MVKLWEVTVQDSKRPFSFTKLRVLAELDGETANTLYEKSLKHLHIGNNVIWMTIANEKKYGVKEKTFCYLEEYEYK